MYFLVSGYKQQFVYIQCVHKVPSVFWKIVPRKQIELAIYSLRQIIVKLGKLFHQ
jgi:hypothetical protein